MTSYKIEIDTVIHNLFNRVDISKSRSSAVEPNGIVNFKIFNKITDNCFEMSCIAAASKETSRYTNLYMSNINSDILKNLYCTVVHNRRYALVYRNTYTILLNSILSDCNGITPIIPTGTSAPIGYVGRGFVLDADYTPLFIIGSKFNKVYNDTTENNEIQFDSVVFRLSPKVFCVNYNNELIKGILKLVQNLYSEMTSTTYYTDLFNFPLRDTWLPIRKCDIIIDNNLKDLLVDINYNDNQDSNYKKVLELLDKLNTENLE